MRALSQLSARPRWRQRAGGLPGRVDRVRRSALRAASAGPTDSPRDDGNAVRGAPRAEPGHSATSEHSIEMTPFAAQQHCHEVVPVPLLRAARWQLGSRSTTMAPPPLDAAERSEPAREIQIDDVIGDIEEVGRVVVDPALYDPLRLRGDPRHRGRDRCTIGLDPVRSPDQRVHVMEREPRRRRESAREPRLAGPTDPDDDDSIAVERVRCGDRRHPETQDSLRGPCPRALRPLGRERVPECVAFHLGTEYFKIRELSMTNPALAEEVGTRGGGDPCGSAAEGVVAAGGSRGGQAKAMKRSGAACAG